MTISIYVDGSGGPNSGFGFYVKENGKSFYKKEPNITNNQAEYMAIISALEQFSGTTEEVFIYSDSKNTVMQLNHEYAINNDHLRVLAQKAWDLISKFSNIQITWIPRNQNLAGKMMGS
ncbi:MAG: ribonuclease HI family protein [Thaumarchaeota archaeon]|nr:ribonuclease HI family protein [Nitrososphaerota archaeon]